MQNNFSLGLPANSEPCPTAWTNFILSEPARGPLAEVQERRQSFENRMRLVLLAAMGPGEPAGRVTALETDKSCTTKKVGKR
jgi:hypothetical protein